MYNKTSMASNGRITRSSLWLVPPADSALSKSLSKLINQTSLFPEAIPPTFAPHITLSGDTISTDLSNPQQWLDNLPLPDLRGLQLTIGELHVGEIFFQKLIQLCDKNEVLCDLAGTCRRAGTGEGEDEGGEWIEGSYRPHLSLMYSDLSREEVLSRLEKVKDLIRETKESNGPDCVTARGASIWLVPTYKDVGEWNPIAERHLNSSIEWKWET